MSKPRKQTIVWVTADDAKVRVCDMTDQHCYNAARWMAVQAAMERERALHANYVRQGVSWWSEALGADLCDEEEWLNETTWEDFIDAIPFRRSLPQSKDPLCYYTALTRELKRRGITRPNPRSPVWSERKTMQQQDDQ